MRGKFTTDELHTTSQLGYRSSGNHMETRASILSEPGTWKYNANRAGKSKDDRAMSRNNYSVLCRTGNEVSRNGSLPSVFGSLVRLGDWGWKYRFASFPRPLVRLPFNPSLSVSQG
jgi:hypothetical protein